MIRCKHLKTCNVSVATSFYSANPDVHARITKNENAHRSIKENIKRVVKAGLPLRVGIIQFPQEEYPDQNIEAAKIYLQVLGVNPKRIDIDEVRGVGRGVTIDVKRANCVDALCGACANGKAVVNENGDVSLCVFTLEMPGMVIGNVREQRLETIVAGLTMHKMRNTLQTLFSQRRSKDDWCNPDNCNPFQGMCKPTLCTPDGA